MSIRVEFYDKVEWRDEFDQLHYEDGPAVEYANGTRFWYVNGHPHRVGAPAIEWANGTCEWWVNGLLHRVDGPAVEWADGSHYCSLFGVEVADDAVTRLRFLDIEEEAIS